MNAKHTPGPWTADSLNKTAPTVRANSRLIAAVHDLCIASQHDEDIANAHLIAAAPELLDACEVWLADLKTPSSKLTTAGLESRINILSKVIAKAKSGTVAIARATNQTADAPTH